MTQVELVGVKEIFRSNQKPNDKPGTKNKPLIFFKRLGSCNNINNIEKTPRLLSHFRNMMNYVEQIALFSLCVDGYFQCELCACASAILMNIR